MSKLYVFCFIACYTVSVVHAGSIAAKASCEEPQSKSMNWLADFANKFKKINICDFKSDSSAIMDSEGRWIVSYRANIELKSEAEAGKLNSNFNNS